MFKFTASQLKSKTSLLLTCASSDVHSKIAWLHTRNPIIDMVRHSNRSTSHQLTKEELAVLAKGMSYVPDFNNNKCQLADSNQCLKRHNYIAHCFKDVNTNSNPWHRKSKWTTPKLTNPSLIELEEEVQSVLTTSLRKENNKEAIILHNFSRNKNLTLKRADRGGDLAVMNTSNYIKKP